MEKVIFTTYTKDDLLQIAKSKVGTQIVDTTVLDFFARKVSATSGDWRKYADLLSQTLRSRKVVPPDAPLPLVRLPHAMMVNRQNNHQYMDLIASLTSLEKNTLCVGVHLSRQLGNRPVPLHLLREYSMQAFGMDPDLQYEVYSLEDFKGVMERLVDHGLLKMDRRFQSFRNSNSTVQFDLQLEDVETALEKTLLKDGFFQRMVERIQGMNVSAVE